MPRKPKQPLPVGHFGRGKTSTTKNPEVVKIHSRDVGKVHVKIDARTWVLRKPED